MSGLRYVRSIATTLKPGDTISFRLAAKAHTLCFIRNGSDLEAPQRGGTYAHQFDLWAWTDDPTEQQCENIAMLIAASHGLAIPLKSPERRGQQLLFELIMSTT